MSVYYLLSLMPVIPHTWSHFNLRTFLAGWRGGGCTLLSLPPWTAYHRCETTAPGYVTIVLPTFVLFLIVVQSLSCVWLFVTPWTEASQASLSFIISQSLLKLMSIESVMPSNHLILSHPRLLLLSIFPSIRVFQISQFFTSGGQSFGVSASKSVLPVNIQDWFPLGWIGWISLQSKGLSRVFSNTTVQKYQFFSAKLSL